VSPLSLGGWPESLVSQTIMENNEIPPTPTKTEALAEKVLLATSPVEAAALVQEVRSTVASEATVMAMRRRNAITLLKEKTQTFLAISLTIATIVAAFTQDEIDETLKNSLFIILGFFLRDKTEEKPPRGQFTRSTDV
jgi:hypothetical protein